ncbi:MAG: hypothetical protein V1686_02575, partial [Patescibacteria group bacterium]
IKINNMKNKSLVSLKKITSYALTLLVVISNFGFIPAAQAVNVPTLTIGSQTALNGAHIVVPITGSNFTIGENITGV